MVLWVPLVTVCHHGNTSVVQAAIWQTVLSHTADGRPQLASYVLQINSNFCSYGSELSNQVGYKSVAGFHTGFFTGGENFSLM